MLAYMYLLFNVDADTSVVGGVDAFIVNADADISVVNDVSACHPSCHDTSPNLSVPEVFQILQRQGFFGLPSDSCKLIYQRASVSTI